jgi:hypothetical protein
MDENPFASFAFDATANSVEENVPTSQQPTVSPQTIVVKGGLRYMGDILVDYMYVPPEPMSESTDDGKRDGE